MNMARTVVPEWLDSLPADDPRAIRSRGDLRRINRIMSATSLLAEALDPLVSGNGPVRMIELGAGDGTLLLRLAQRRARDWPPVRLGLLDLQPVVKQATLDGYNALGWQAEVIGADVFDWLANDSTQRVTPLPVEEAAPIIVANLFLHHFDGQPLTDLLHGLAARARAVVCVEPRRSRFALLGSRLLGAIGCNDVTRHDAAISVRAGFRGHELSALWPQDSAWQLQEAAAGLFSHRFIAVRDEGHPGAVDRSAAPGLGA